MLRLTLRYAFDTFVFIAVTTTTTKKNLHCHLICAHFYFNYNFHEILSVRSPDGTATLAIIILVRFTPHCIYLNFQLEQKRK